MTLGNAIFNVAGILEGIIITTLWYKAAKTESGVLRIDHSNPEKDVYRFEIDDIDNLSKKKHVVLKIDNNAKLS